MSEINGITDFLDQAGTQFSVFDMGRRIEEIPRDVFHAFEQGELAYPLPLQQQAWLGFVVWNEKENDELVIWFLRFPLDATGKLTAGIRDDFVLRLINREQTEQNDESNPYGFKAQAGTHGLLSCQGGKTAGQTRLQLLRTCTGLFCRQARL